MGRTSQQMKDAPLCATYIVPEFFGQYHVRLAMHLGRGDLEISSTQALNNLDAWRGRRIPAKILDHAVTLTPEERRVFDSITTTQDFPDGHAR